jgi:hypothetical protein
MLQLWGFAQHSPRRLPEAIVAGRQREYFHLRLAEAIARLPKDNELLTEVLEEIILIATGEDEIIGWRPVTLVEARTRIGEPLTCAQDRDKCHGLLTGTCRRLGNRTRKTECADYRRPWMRRAIYFCSAED